MRIGAAGTAGAKTENTPAKGWRGHEGRGWAGACLGGYPHAGALKWAVRCGTCQKTPKIGRGRGGVLVQGAHVRAQSFTKSQVGSFSGGTLGDGGVWGGGAGANQVVG